MFMKDIPMFMKDNATVETKQLVIDGVQIAPLPLRDVQEIQRAFKKLEDAAKEECKKASAAEEEKKEAVEEKDAAIAAADADLKAAKVEIEKRDAIIVSKDSEIETLKSQLADAMSPDKLDAASEARSTTIDTARKLLGDAKADFKGKSLEAIRRQVVDKRLGAKAKDWTDAQVQAVFDSSEGPAPKQNGGGNYQDAAAVFAQPHFNMTDAEKVKDQAYNEYESNITNAWQGANRTQ